jgi:hypothetical protein
MFKCGRPQEVFIVVKRGQLRIGCFKGLSRGVLPILQSFVRLVRFFDSFFAPVCFASLESESLHKRAGPPEIESVVQVDIREKR